MPRWEEAIFHARRVCLMPQRGNERLVPVLQVWWRRGQRLALSVIHQAVGAVVDFCVWPIYG